MVITIPIFILTFTLNFIHINHEYKKDPSVRKLIINYKKIKQPYIRCFFVGAILVGLIMMTTIGLYVLMGLNIISTACSIGLLFSTFFLEQKLRIMIYSSVN